MHLCNVWRNSTTRLNANMRPHPLLEAPTPQFLMVAPVTFPIPLVKLPLGLVVVVFQVETKLGAIVLLMMKR